MRWLYQNPLIKSPYNLFFLRWVASLAGPLIIAYRRGTRLLAQPKNPGVLKALSFGVWVLLILFLGGGLQAEAAWQAEPTQAMPTASPALTHLSVTLRGDDPAAGPLQAHLVKFDRAHGTLRVIDLAPGQSVADGAAAAHALAGVNGGYFLADRTPLGLMISRGVTLHPWENSKLLTGVLSVPQRGNARLLRSAEFHPAGVREALQSGPFLVDHGKAVAGLNAAKAAERTVLLADRKGVAALLTTGPVTLAELARILATPGLFQGLEIDRALNLDGGSSTALWVARESAPFSRPEWKRVRNAVIVAP
jgi:hypothetical protein